MRRLLPALLFFAALGLAHWLTMQSWNGAVYVYVGERRAPAAVRSVRDYSAIDHRAIYRKAHEQLLAGAELIKRDGQLGVVLGHPLVSRPEDGSREFACHVPGQPGAFERVEITFYGTGITDNGRSPYLVIDTNCSAAVQIDRLATIWIPMQDIVKSTPRDQELQIPGSTATWIRLKNIPDQWPENWTLWSVRFYRPDAIDESLIADAIHLREGLASALMSFEWRAP